MSAGSRLSSALRSNAEVNQSATLVSRAKHVMRADASCHCALRPTACHWKANSHIRECSQATQCRLLQKSSAKRLLSTPRQRPRQRWEPRAQLIRFRAPVHTRAHREQHARMPEPTARPQPPARQRRSGRALTPARGRPPRRAPTCCSPALRTQCTCAPLDWTQNDSLRPHAQRPPSQRRARPAGHFTRSLSARHLLHLLLGLAGELRKAHAHARGVLHKFLATPLHALRAPGGARAPQRAPGPTPDGRSPARALEQHTHPHAPCHTLLVHARHAAPSLLNCSGRAPSVAAAEARHTFSSADSRSFRRKLSTQSTKQRSTSVLYMRRLRAHRPPSAAAPGGGRRASARSGQATAEAPKAAGRLAMLTAVRTGL